VAPASPSRAPAPHGYGHRRGLRHRDDGPAASYPDGRRIWFRDGVKVKEERAAR
jgi:hypothetical protein